MRTTLVGVAVTVVACLFVSCAQKEPDLAGLKKTIAEYNAASKASLMGGDQDKTLTYFDTDGMEMPPNMGPAKGKDAIKEMWTRMMGSGVKITAVEFTGTDIEVGGTIGYESGTYTMTIEVPKMGSVQDNGKYITLWHLKDDGSWKLYAEMWSSNVPFPPTDKMDAKKK